MTHEEILTQVYLWSRDCGIPEHVLENIKARFNADADARAATLAECLKVVEKELDKAQQNMLEFHRLGLNAARDAASEVTAYQRIATLFKELLREIGKEK
jgi:hypothetical protein